MNTKKIKIKIFSVYENNSIVELAIRRINFPDTEIILSKPKNYKVSNDDLLICGVDNITDDLLTHLIRLNKNSNNTLLLYTFSKNPLLITNLVRLGFYSIFLFPEELPKFKSFLLEIVENKPFVSEDVLKSENIRIEKSFEKIIGDSPIILENVKMAKKIASKPKGNLLILGETGTGKGVFAKAIHDASPNYKEPFVDIVCSTIPNSLIESELFGFEKGAFTDATYSKEGLLEIAGNGTIFLDEIGDLPIEVQVKLLRAVENKTIRRLGGTRDIEIKGRIIAATNRNIENMLETKEFRKDLYYRLNVLQLTLPPLRKRGEDAIVIAEHFINEISKEFNKNVPSLEDDLKAFILEYDWPGNIRELRNSIERAIILLEGDSLNLSDLFSKNENVLKNFTVSVDNYINMQINYSENTLKTLSKIYAKEVFYKLNQNKTKTAKVLGITRPTLDNLLQ